ncbi:hypothetical protein [Pseudomonas sp. RIT-PI-S]|uniref:hypothetical protein n=1 Tax=Pseudomonas sp. RIT-PI-S TaxID=3035295 RepID=UPI0021D87E47|nr:hypothetical protein [Pseudomonas sp. RIT-PI-S]
MNRTSIYDRLSERRLAQEAAALAEQQAAGAVQAPLAQPEPVVPLQDAPSSFSFAGFNLLLPEGFRFRDIQMTLEQNGEPVALAIQRRDVHEGATLDGLLAQALQALRVLHPELRLIRERDCTLAGSAAMAVDFRFSLGNAERHGRLVVSIVPVTGGQPPQWLSLSCVVDPLKPSLSAWLIDFDTMLLGMTAR